MHVVHGFCMSQSHSLICTFNRKDTKTIFLRNSTFLPAAWRVTGLENLGDDFSVSQDQGIVAPRTEYGLQLHFKAAKATNIKKFIRLEVLNSPVYTLCGGLCFFFFLSSLDYLISWRWNPLSDWPVGMFFLLPVGLWCGEHSGNCPAGKHSCVCRIIWCVLGYQLPKRYLNFTIPITRLSNQTLYTVGKSRIFPYQCVLYPCYMINKWLGQLLIIY